MQKKNTPSLDNRYWIAMLFASLLGTTFGDFVSHDLNLGFVSGLWPLGAILAAILFIERQAAIPSEAYYWAAVVITRTAATNLGDLATHSFQVDYWQIGVGLTVLLAIILLVGRKNESKAQDQGRSLPATDLRYWAALLVASTLGTTQGDFVTDGLGFGVRNGSLLLGAFLAVLLCVQSRIKMQNKACYWVMIVIVRTTGTAMGDYLSGEDGLNLGFGYAATSVGLLLAGIICLWRKQKNPA